MGIAVCARDALWHARASVLAQHLGLPLADEPEALPAHCTHVLWLGPEGLSLGLRGQKVPAATRVDFLDGTLQYRLKTSGKRQGIGKAAGLDKSRHITLLDATAGLGRDALVLAHLGCEVTLIEKSPIVHSLLADGFARARVHGGMDATLNRMTLLQGNAMARFAAICQQQIPRPDVIYLDPMFPPRNSSASVKKDMALLQSLLGVDDNFPQMFEAALASAEHRVVVKRPGHKPGKEARVAPNVPGFVVPGKSAYFEVYVNSSFSSMR